MCGSHLRRDELGWRCGECSFTRPSARWVLDGSKVIDANGPGALDGFRVDTEGNLWCGWGSNGSPQAKSEELDGVMTRFGFAAGMVKLSY